jgi:hypothetical protein
MPSDTDSEYRPTDWFVMTGMSYGIGYDEAQAIVNAIRYAGPWEDADHETISATVWKLYADSWTSHSLRGPERGAEVLERRTYEIPVELADDLSRCASGTYEAYWRALEKAETTDEWLPDEDESAEGEAEPDDG